MNHRLALSGMEGNGKLNVHKQDYRGSYLPTGLCMFKVLVMGSYLDFIDTSGMICTQIRNLDPYLSQTGNNIVKFNAHVQTLIDTLTSRGQMNHVLLT